MYWKHSEQRGKRVLLYGCIRTLVFSTDHDRARRRGTALQYRVEYGSAQHTACRKRQQPRAASQRRQAGNETASFMGYVRYNSNRRGRNRYSPNVFCRRLHSSMSERCSTVVQCTVEHRRVEHNTQRRSHGNTSADHYRKSHPYSSTIEKKHSPPRR